MSRLTILIWGLLVAPLAAPSAMAASQSFYLECDDALYLTADAVTCAGGDKRRINPNCGNTFTTAVPAGATVEFPIAGWTGTLTRLDPAPVDGPTDVVIYATSDPLTKATATVSWSGNTGTFTTTGAGVIEVPTGASLAVELCNGSTGAGNNAKYDLSTDGDSFVTSPTGSDPYPSPELTTLVLFGAGLAVLGCVAYLRRRD